MAIETRNDRGSYYYTSQRIGGHVVKEYHGSGITAGLMAEYDQLERNRREMDRIAWRQERDRLQRIEDKLNDFFRQVHAAKSVYLERAGYHQHDRGHWRKRRMPKMLSTADERATHDLIAAQRGDQKALQRAQDHFTQAYPDAKDTWASFAVPQYTLLLEMIAESLYGENLLLLTAFKHQAERMRQELSVEKATPLEQMMIDQVAIAWAWSHEADTRLAHLSTQSNITLTKMEHYQKVAIRAAKRYQSALVDLARIRRLKLPIQQINIAQSGAKQVNIATQNAAIASPMPQNADDIDTLDESERAARDRYPEGVMPDRKPTARDILGGLAEK